MKFLFAILALACVGMAHAAPTFNLTELEDQFKSFKTQFKRVYLSLEEEAFRKGIFAGNFDFIFRHNLEYVAGRKTFNVSVNNFTDITSTEFRALFNGLRMASKVNQSLPIQPTVSINPTTPLVPTSQVNTTIVNPTAIYYQDQVQALPDTVDWTTKGVVTPVKDQGQCGGCWAFSAVAAIEGQHALKTGSLVSLSEQNLIDCSSPEGNYGCNGGLADNAFQYVIQNNGIDTEASYGYMATDETCQFNANNIGATISSFTDVQSGSEDALQNAVATIGPISVGIDASQQSFQFYSSGVYNEPACSSTQLDHGVTAVGYGTQSGQAYWKVKNSWGTSWGEQGYILMSRNVQNQCGIATQASYPTV